MVDTEPDTDAPVAVHQNRRASPNCGNEDIGKIVCVKDLAYIMLVLLSCFLKFYVD